MLSYLSVRNFKLADQVELDFNPGFTVLTGETGAGKSLIVDALGLILGDRANPDTISAATDKAEIEAVFAVPEDHQVQHWLLQHELDAHGECVIRRVISRHSSSRGFINGRASPIQKLKELGELLVDIHGQHAHQRLLQPGIQREALDAFVGLRSELRELSELHRQMTELDEKLHRLRNRSQEDRAEAQLLEFQINELLKLAPREGEMPELEQEHRKLAHGRELLEGISSIVDNLIDSENNVLQIIDRHQQQLRELGKHDTGLESAGEQLNEASIVISELATDLRSRLEGYEFDPARLQQLDERIGSLHSAARKYQVKAETLPEFLADCQSRLENLAADDDVINAHEADLAATTSRYEELADLITNQRQRGGKQLQKLVESELHDLSLASARFVVSLIPNRDNERARWGKENVLFEISTNPGMPPGPLSKVASGGELSRTSLSINVVANAASPAMTQVYDEVDVGIGGGVAEIVGQKLRSLGTQRQVLCVTHLPQVASQGESHLRVSKQDNERSTVKVDLLDDESRTDEIARMLGGVEITTQTMDHAREMLRKAV